MWGSGDATEEWYAGRSRRENEPALALRGLVGEHITE